MNAALQTTSHTAFPAALKLVRHSTDPEQAA